MQDPNVERKNNFTKSLEQTVFAPKIIEFSASGLCNRKCVFCPRSSSDYNHINSHIDSNLIEKISLELAEARNDYFFLFSGFSEPLLSKELESWISILKKGSGIVVLKSIQIQICSQSRESRVFLKPDSRQSHAAYMTPKTGC